MQQGLICQQKEMPDRDCFPDGDTAVKHSDVRVFPSVGAESPEWGRIRRASCQADPVDRISRPGHRGMERLPGGLTGCQHDDQSKEQRAGEESLIHINLRAELQ
jgi:hypothetical protein